MTRIPLAEADTYGMALRRTRRLRIGLAAALVVVAAAALAAAWALRPAKPALLPPGTSGVIVLDVSSSIGVRTHKQIAHTLASAARTRDRYGLVLFSESAYEALPPGTPSAELRRYERLFRPVGELETDPGPDGLVPLGDAEGETLSGGAGGARFPASPWRGDFSAGTRISEGLRLAQRILERDRIRDGSVLLVSDLDDDQSDLPSLTQALLEYRLEGTPIRVVGLAPDSRNRTLFARLLGSSDPITAAPVGDTELDTPPAPYDRTRAPVLLALAAAVLLLLLALNELWLARVTWRSPLEARA
jgi:hypothetical protein